MNRVTLALVLAIWCACSQAKRGADDDDRRAAVSDGVAGEGGTSEGPAEEPPHVLSVDLVEGLTLTTRSDGHLLVEGVDRWKQPLKAEYESAAYLRDALPVLANSITEAQAAALARALDGGDQASLAQAR
jgi:hypothetical protein